MDRHDLDAFVACFDPDYHSEQPVHPDRTFVGSDQVRKNWSALFAGLPDFQVELLRSAVNGDEVWSEWHWQGTQADGTRVHLRGVTILEVRNGSITRGRLYMEPVDEGGAGIGAAVDRLAGSTSVA
jgi:ketosteroid isomerase-like protein